MSCVIDLIQRRRLPTLNPVISHPCGVVIPVGKNEATQFLAPELRREVADGAYAADLIECLPASVLPGDRVLLLGGGLGVVSTLIAKEHAADRVIALKADTRVASYLQSVHALNGASLIETVNAVPTNGEIRRVPYFARRDLRTSSLLPDEGDWETAMRVPSVHLGLILADAQIDFVVCDLPASMLAVLENAALDRVDRILVRTDGDAGAFLGENQTAEFLISLGFAAKAFGTVVLFDRGMHRGDRRAVH